MKLSPYIIILITVLASCDDTAAVLNINNPKIKEAYESRRKEYINENLKNCREDIIGKAEIYVDSLIAAEIDYRINDSIIFPEKPIKPEWPGAIIVPDSIKARPIFR
ncbi:MAG: hypothetical protein WAT22_17655 [Saprospiraceae bacterium]|jgi:hypothetical protein|nr:hypothetical protein [Saprospiraceae bacterium]MBK9567537.1 hypothetical protein [Saprospiraceae bacterium]MBP6445655.1 hypothetical protein [Saprospiraceae bacterium]